MEEQELQSPIYYMRLMNGDSIIGRSDDDMDKINDIGYVVMRDIMKVKNQMMSSPHGELSEIMMILPWLEGTYITQDISIPTDTIVAASMCKNSLAFKYAKHVAGYKLRETIMEDSFTKAFAKMESESNDQQEEAASEEEPKMLIVPQPPRQPEMLSPQRMMEAEMDGELDEEEDDSPSAKPSADLSYQVDGKTYH